MIKDIIKSININYYILLLYIIVSIFVLGANPFQGETIAPIDLLISGDGWSSFIDSEVKVKHPERSDVIDHTLPNWIYFKKTILSGQVPLWNPNNSGGTPGIQFLAYGTFTPSFLCFLMIEDDASGFYFSCLIKLLIAGFGTYLLLRIFLSPVSSFFGGIVFMLCGFNAAWFFVPAVSTSIWIPWLLWSTLLYLKNNNYRWLTGITVTSLFLILGGFPSVAAYGLYSFALLLAVFNVSDYKDKKTFILKTILPIFSVLVAFMISSLPLISLLELLSQTNLGYRHGGTCLTIKDFPLFIYPHSLPRVEKTLYIGIPALLLSFFGISTVLYKDKKNKRGLKIFSIFAVILLFVSIIIAFGLINHKIIRMIPTFGFNAWNRLIIIIDLSMAILSAIGFDRVVKILRKRKIINFRFTLIFILIVFSCQLYDQKRIFNKFNYTVESDWFYPVTPTIDYLSQNIKPLQSVIADHSYIISGVLSAYSIPEWFAHNFKTDNEKLLLSKIVKDPFRSPTAATFPGSDILLENSLLDAFGIKYILINKRYKDSLFNTIYIKQPGIGHKPAPPLPKHKLTQNLVIDKKIKITGISLLLATYHQQTSPADLILIFRRKNDNKILREITIKKEDISDNSWVNFNFNKPLILQKGNYNFELILKDYYGDLKLTVWTSDKPINPDNFLEVDGKKRNISMQYKIFVERNLGENIVKKIYSRLKMLSLEDHIVLIERENAPNGAYFINNLSDTPDKITFNKITTTVISNSEIIIDNKYNKKGWIVLPVRYYPGWKGYINSNIVKVEKYLDVFPAIKVTGPSIILYMYKPDSMRYGLIISLFGIIIFIVLSIVVIKKE